MSERGLPGGGDTSTDFPDAGPAAYDRSHLPTVLRTGLTPFRPALLSARWLGHRKAPGAHGGHRGAAWTQVGPCSLGNRRPGKQAARAALSSARRRPRPATLPRRSARPVPGVFRDFQPEDIPVPPARLSQREPSAAGSPGEGGPPPGPQPRAALGEQGCVECQLQAPHARWPVWGRQEETLGSWIESMGFRAGCLGWKPAPRGIAGPVRPLSAADFSSATRAWSQAGPPEPRAWASPSPGRCELWCCQGFRVLAPQGPHSSTDRPTQESGATPGKSRSAVTSGDSAGTRAGKAQEPGPSAQCGSSGAGRPIPAHVVGRRERSWVPGAAILEGEPLAVAVLPWPPGALGWALAPAGHRTHRRLCLGLSPVPVRPQMALQSLPGSGAVLDTMPDPSQGSQDLGHA